MVGSQGKSSSINIKSTIKSHKEKKFLQIMEIDGITPKDIANSLSVLDNHDNIFTAGEGAGQSGVILFLLK